MKMTFADAVKSGFKNFANFKGTATRTEFWYFYLFNVLLNMVLTTFDSIVAPESAFGGATGAGPLYTLANLLLVLPNLSIGVRRFHDAGFSAKWMLLWLVPVIAFFVGGGYFLASAPIAEMTTTEGAGAVTEAQLAAAVLPLAPAALLAAALGVLQLVVYLKASRSWSQGNKYAAPGETETSASE